MNAAFETWKKRSRGDNRCVTDTVIFLLIRGKLRAALSLFYVSPADDVQTFVEYHQFTQFPSQHNFYCHPHP
jgi:hypothetical protein